MISFIIPTFNEEKIIEKTLKNISRYSGENEIIVSDDNSSDKTISIARKYTNQIVENSKEGRGISANRNRGARAAQGEYFAFIDADINIGNSDWLFKKALEIFQKDKKIIALTVFIRVFPSLETFADKIILGFFNYLFLILNNFFHIGASSGEFQMIRADTFKKVGGFNENLVTGEDQDMFRRLAKIGQTRSERGLAVYNDGRRAHTMGWPKLLWLWTRDTLSIFLFKKSTSKTWKDIR